METPGVWEQLLIGVVVVLVLMWMMPGIRASFRERKSASQADWMGVLLPIGLVALFVIVLIALV